MADDPGLALTDEEVKAIIMSLARSRGDKGFTEIEVQVIVDWAIEVRVKAAMLEGILDGMFLVDLKGGDDVTVSIPPEDRKLDDTP